MKGVVLALLLVTGALLVDGGVFRFKKRRLAPREELAWRYGAVVPQEEPALSFLYSPNELLVESAIASHCK